MLFQLPIRLGRNALNDCQLNHPFISDFHADIEWVDGRLCVRHLHSRNGLYSPSGDRIALQVPFLLASTINAFVLGRVLHRHVDVIEQVRQRGARLSATRGAVLGNRAVLGGGRDGQHAPPRHPGGRAAVRGGAAAAPVRAGRLDAAPSVRGRGQPSLERGGLECGPHNQSLPALAPLQQQGQNPAIPAAPPGWQQPAWTAAPQAQSRAAAGRRHGDRSTQHFSLPVETLAMLGLKELAGSLVPGVPLQTTGDVARLLTKLHDTVEVFCRSFVPLREGYAQFVSSMDLNRAASQRALNRLDQCTGGRGRARPGQPWRRRCSTGAIRTTTHPRWSKASSPT